jgi:hypothetical protein
MSIVLAWQVSSSGFRTQRLVSEMAWHDISANSVALKVVSSMPQNHYYAKYGFRIAA